MKTNALLSILLASSVWARDPFLATHVERCSAKILPPDAWQLQGVIGSAGRFEAWLLLSSGKRLHIRQDERLPDTTWQVAHIDLQHVLLKETTACHPQIDLILKGKNHVKKNRSDSADD